MKAALRLCLLCLLFATVSAWAGVVGSTNPALFPNTIDWCAQPAFNCGDIVTTPQPFVSSWGSTGLVGLPFSSSNFQVLQAGTSLFGSSFPDGMGVLYNGVSTLGNPEDAFLLIFDQPQWGAGAYIQTWSYGPFDAAVLLYDTSLNFMGAFQTTGMSSDQLSDLLFIGAQSNSGRNVGAAIFVAADMTGSLNFDIGTVGLATPEPSSIVLAAPSMLGLFGVLRYRRSRKSQEVL